MNTGEFLDIDEKKLDLILQDNALRDELGIGAGTGPKGVKADYKFHQKQEKLREQEKTTQYLSEISSRALKSGWIDREIARENFERNPHSDNARVERDEDEETDELIRELEDEIEDQQNPEMLVHLVNDIETRRRLYQKTRYGMLQTIPGDQFISIIEQTDSEVMVFIHISNPRLPECRILDSLLASIARKYPGSRFITVQRDEINAKFDDRVMPVVVCYRGGDLVDTLCGFAEGLGEWKRKGTCEVEDLEEFLVKKGLLSEDDIVDAGY